MTPRAKRLKPLLKIASRKEENAANTLASSNQELKSHQEKLEQMKQYRNEYANNSTASSITAGMLRDKQQFIQQIDQAIELLEQQIRQQHLKISSDQKSWLQAKQKTDAYDKVIEKIQLTEQNINDEREQREIDDRVCKIKAK